MKGVSDYQNDIISISIFKYDNQVYNNILNEIINPRKLDTQEQWFLGTRVTYSNYFRELRCQVKEKEHWGKVLPTSIQTQA